MSGIGKKEIGLSVVGLLMGRVLLFSINPMAVGYFIALCGQRRCRAFYLAAVGIGMAMVMPPVQLFTYMTTMIVVLFVISATEKKGRILTLLQSSGLAAVFLFAIELARKGVSELTQEDLIVLVAEAGLILVSAYLFEVGIHYIFHCKKGQPMNNEELISIVLLLGIAVYGMPVVTMYRFSIIETAVFLILLILGYKYGAGAGTIAGVVCGTIVLLKNGGDSWIGTYCFLGFCSGLFRKTGKILTAFVIGGCYAGLGMYWQTDLFVLENIRGFASALLVFLLLPRKWTRPVEASGYWHWENSFAKQTLQLVTKRKLTEFSESFRQLAKTFYSISDLKTKLDKKDMDKVLEELTENLCKQCEKSNRCLGYTRHERYQTSLSMLEAVNAKGCVVEGDLPRDFSNKCSYLDSFVQEANRELEFAKLNLNWKNRMAESREAIADQLEAVGNLLEEFSVELYEMEDISSETEEAIRAVLKRNFVDLKKIAVLEKKNKKQELYLSARAKAGRCISTREVATYVGEVMGKRFRPALESKNILSNEYERVVLVEDTNFKVLTGIARRNKDGEEVCGDNFSFTQLETGEMIMTLADGMGAGVGACEESCSVVELLEQFMEAGFKEETAIRLINSILVLKSNEQTFSTLDMAVINLFTGICDFIKIGAATTFIKRNDWVESISAHTMPIGVFNQVDYDNVSKKLYDGDYIIMVSDGVLDAVEEPKEEFIEQLLLHTKVSTPREMANMILREAEKRNGDVAADDMTVMVAGIWRK